jgi:hypothetical protein
MGTNIYAEKESYWRQILKGRASRMKELRIVNLRGAGLASYNASNLFTEGLLLSTRQSVLAPLRFEPACPFKIVRPSELIGALHLLVHLYLLQAKRAT